MRRPLHPGRLRAPAAAILGEGPIAIEAARRLRAADAGRVIVPFEGGGPVDALLVCDARATVVRDAALWAARVCPYTVLVIAARDGLALCAQALQASGLAPGLILCTGAMPRAASEAAALAARLGVSAAQVCVTVIGGDGTDDMLVLRRYSTIAGVPAAQLEGAAALPAPSPPPASDSALGRAAAALALAVLQDRRQVLCCGAWVQGAFGLPGGYVSVPVRVGARGAEQPLELRLTLEERAALQRCSRPA